MVVKLLFNSPLMLAIRAASITRDRKVKTNYIGEDTVYSPKDLQLLARIIKMNETSVIEHINYTFEISEITRVCLQQLVRHRIASYSVQSTRWTLKKQLMKEDRENLSYKHPDIIDKYIAPQPLPNWIANASKQLQYIYDLLEDGVPVDEVKYALPESYYTKLVMTINARSLRNFFNLRMSKKAHPEIRALANNMFNLIPDSHKILFRNI